MAETMSMSMLRRSSSSSDKIIDDIPLISPQVLKYNIPLTEDAVETVISSRLEISSIVHGVDDRLLVVVGPCSIHDCDAAIEYAMRLREVAARLSKQLCVVMRAYLEKPRTTVGWKGLINDPNIDGTCEINKGLAMARRLYRDITHLGLPIAGETLDTVTPEFLFDALSLGAIGARTTESQPHRQIASAAPFPVGFKNGTDGSIDVAVDGMTAAAGSHKFLAIGSTGLPSIIHSSGNPDCFVILRGGKNGSNYGEDHISEATKMLNKGGFSQRMMVDCSHGNSNKDYRNQGKVAGAIGDLVRRGETRVMGVMIESNLTEGKQSVGAPSVDEPIAVKRDVSITDGCIGWEETVKVLEDLANAVTVRRQAKAASKDHFLTFRN